MEGEYNFFQGERGLSSETPLETTDFIDPGGISHHSPLPMCTPLSAMYRKVYIYVNNLRMMNVWGKGPEH